MFWGVWRFFFHRIKLTINLAPRWIVLQAIHIFVTYRTVFLTNDSHTTHEAKPVRYKYCKFYNLCCLLWNLLTRTRLLQWFGASSCRSISLVHVLVYDRIFGIWRVTLRSDVFANTNCTFLLLPCLSSSPVQSTTTTSRTLALHSSSFHPSIHPSAIW